MLLLVSDRRELRRALTAALTQRGIFLMDAPIESAAHVSHEKDTGGILLDTRPEPKRASGLFVLLRERYPEMPIALLAAPTEQISLPADAILRQEAIESLAEESEEFYRLHCGWSCEVLSSHALSVGLSTGECRYLGYPLSLTPVERRILACLFYRAPRETSGEDLLELCCASSAHTVRNVAVHISRINRAASHIDPRPLIVNRYGVGYRLREGILEVTSDTLQTNFLTEVPNKE